MRLSRLGRLAALVLVGIGAACDTGAASAPTAPTVAPVTDTSTVSVGRGLRRLSRREYDNVVRDLLGDTTRPAERFGLEVYVNGFDNGSDGLTVQGTDVLALQAAAEDLAAQAVANRRPLLIGSCDPKIDEGACLDELLKTFPKKAYRRPPTEGELGRLRDVYAVGAAAGGFDGGVQLVLEAILQAPAFLYREELGVTDPSLSARFVRLTDYEVASELSFLILGSMPDEELFAAVERGSLKTAEDLRREAVRLIALPAARPAFRAFLHQWMATDQLASVSKDAQVYPAFTAGLGASMAGELDRYFDDVLWARSGSLRELLTSTQSFVDPSLAPLYGLTPSTTGTGFSPATLDPATRRGVLTRLGFLATHGDTDSSGPVPRGVFVLNALLCSPPGPPPANVPSAPPVSRAVEQHQTTRQRFDGHLAQPFCQTCHRAIDGIGFGFEQFDGLGVFRTTENGTTVDSSGILTGTDIDGPFLGASELGGKLVGSPQMLGCFMKQVYRFAMGQEESASAQKLLEALGRGFSADARMTDVFTSLVADPAFVLRSTTRVP